MCKTRYFWASYIIHRLYNYAKSAIYSGLRDGVSINLAMYINFFLLDKIDGNYHIDTKTLETTSNSHITTRITGNVLTVLLS